MSPPLRPPEAPVQLRGAVGRGVAWAVVFVIVALAVAGLVATAGDHGPRLRELWARSDAARLLLGWAVMTSGIVALAARWRAFFPRDSGATLGPLSAILFVGMLLNYALPGPVGELVGAGLAARRFRVGTEVALAAGVAARLVGLALAGVAAFSVVELGLVPLDAAMAPWLRSTAAVVALAVVVLLGLGAFPHRLEQLAAATLGRVAFLASLHASVVRFAHALAGLRHAGPGPWSLAAGWALVGHGLVMGGLWIAGTAFGAPPQLGGLAFTYAASTAGAVLLFAFPGGQLGWDALFTTLLTATAGLDVPAAMTLTLCARLHQLSLVVIGALLLLRSMRDGTNGLGG